MNPEEIGSRLQKFQDYQRDHAAKTADELDVLLIELNNMASDVHTLPAGDKQATSAKIDELRRQYTAWYNAAATTGDAAQAASQERTVQEIDLEYHRYRQDWSTAAGADKDALLAEIIDCLKEVEGMPDGELVAAPIRDFLANANVADPESADPH